ALPLIPKDTIWHNGSWFLLHPLWGVGFLIIVNRAVISEQKWIRVAQLPLLISLFATLGVFSYSIYLTHELTIMQSWRWTNSVSSQFTKVLLVIPATILFAWIFFWFCERPFMAKRRAKSEGADEESEVNLNHQGTDLLTKAFRPLSQPD